MEHHARIPHTLQHVRLKGLSSYLISDTGKTKLICNICIMNEGTFIFKDSQRDTMLTFYQILLVIDIVVAKVLDER